MREICANGATHPTAWVGKVMRQRQNRKKEPEVTKTKTVINKDGETCQRFNS